MRWVLQNNIFNEAGWDKLVEVLGRFGLPFYEFKVVPFVGELYPEPDPNLGSEPVICFGSYSMRHAAKRYGWSPGVFDLQAHDFREQLERWGDRMLNASSKVMPFKDVDISEAMFMRPIDDSKNFAGRVFEVDEFNEWKRKVVVLEQDYGDGLSKDTLVQVMQPVNIKAEYRTWVVKGKVVTQSLYKRGAKVMYSSDVDQRIIDYANECVDIWQPLDAFVLDICEVEDGLRIVEINTLNSAGFYAADVQLLVMALEDAFS